MALITSGIVSLASGEQIWKTGGRVSVADGKRTREGVAEEKDEVGSGVSLEAGKATVLEIVGEGENVAVGAGNVSRQACKQSNKRMGKENNTLR